MPLMPPPIPPGEAQRLRCLHSLQILDTPPDPALDAVTELLARRLDCPVALLSLVDEHRQWFKSRQGLDTAQTPREDAFCAHAIAQPDALVVPDARLDPRFADNPLVTGEPRLRFYAGQALRVDGHAIGSLCVLDRAPRHWDAQQAALLAAMATLVESLLAAQWRQRQAALELARLHDFALASGAVMWECDAELRLTWLGPVAPAQRALAQAMHDGSWRAGVPLDELGRPQPGRPGPALALAGLGGDAADAALDAAYEVQTPEGARPLSMRAMPVRGRGGEVVGWRGVARDIATGLQVRRQSREAEAHDRRHRDQLDFLARVGHELRTPLHAVLSFCQLVRDEIEGQVPAHVQRWLGLVDAGGRHLLELAESLGLYCEMEHRSLDRGSLALAPLAQCCVELMRPQAEARGQRLALAVPAGLHALAAAQPLRQVLFNLLGNAIKFGPVGGLVRVEARADGGGVHLRVLDQGPGIPPQLMHRLFTPFDRLGVQPAAVPGNGLGLAVSQSLVQAMGGHIRAENLAGGGCCFTVTLPAAVPPSDAAAPLEACRAAH